MATWFSRPWTHCWRILLRLSPYFVNSNKHLTGSVPPTHLFTTSSVIGWKIPPSLQTKRKKEKSPNICLLHFIINKTLNYCKLKLPMLTNKYAKEIYNNYTLETLSVALFRQINVDPERYQTNTTSGGC